MTNDIVLSADNNIFIVSGFLFEHLPLGDFKAIYNLFYHFIMFFC